jgi:hypothetical protein
MKLRHTAIALALLAAFASDSWGQSKQAPAQSKQSAEPPAADQRGTDKVPFSVKIVPAPDSKEKTDKEEHERKEKAIVDEKLAFETQRIADYTNRLALFTVFLFCAAVAQAGLFVWQLLLIRASLTDAKIAADAAKEAADAAKAQIKLARDDFNATHRPKIRIKNVWLAQQLLPDTPVIVDILLVNVGNVPAVIANVGLDFNVINPELGMLPGNLEPPRVPTDAIGMICGLGITIRINGIGSRAPFDEARIDAIQQGRRTLCCFGAVEYFDTGPEETRRIRRTSFYRVFKPFPQAIDGMGRFVVPDKSDPDYEYED